MARPREEGIKWFPYHSNTLDDKTFISLVRRYGGKAFTLFHFIKGEICRASYYMKPDEDLLHKALFLIPELTEEDYHMLLGVFIEKDLFDRDLYEQYGVLTSAQIQNDYFHGIDHRSRSENFTEYLLVEAPDFEARAKKKAEKKTSSKTAKTAKKTTTKKASKKEAQNSVQTAEQEDVEPNCRIFSCKNREEENRIDEKRGEQLGVCLSSYKLTLDADAISQKKVANAPCFENTQQQAMCDKGEGEAVEAASPKACVDTLEKAALPPAPMVVRNGTEPNKPSKYPVEQLVQIVLKSKSFRKELREKHRLLPNEIPLFLEKFRIDCCMKMQNTLRTPGEFFRHFCNWIKYHLDIIEDKERYNQLVAFHGLIYIKDRGYHPDVYKIYDNREQQHVLSMLKNGATMP
jgi:hypothetical protein